MTALDNGHEHTFEPWPGECGVYRCTCGASGYRRDGAVVPHKKPWTQREAPSARPSEASAEGWVEPKKGAE